MRTTVLMLLLALSQSSGARGEGQKERSRLSQLAAALLAAGTDDERAVLLSENPSLVTNDLAHALLAEGERARDEDNDSLAEKPFRLTLDVAGRAVDDSSATARARSFVGSSPSPSGSTISTHWNDASTVHGNHGFEVSLRLACRCTNFSRPFIYTQQGIDKANDISLDSIVGAAGDKRGHSHGPEAFVRCEITA